jgi:hypothetical protein
MRRGRQQQRVAVGRSPRDLLGGDVATSADPGFGDDWLAEPLRQFGAEHAGDGVGIAARRKTLNELDGPARIFVLRVRRRCAKRERGPQHAFKRP